ncbi:MAG: PaaI family thioesterase [Pseudomonadota bacterium]
MAETENPADAPTGTALDLSGPPSSAVFLGYEFLSVDRDAQSMRVAFSSNDQMLNPSGNVQGGMLTAMLDDVMGSMMFVLLNGKKTPASVDLHTQFLRPAKPGRFVGEARVKHMTNSTAFVDATLYNDADEAIATAVQTLRLFPVRAKGE